MKWKKLVSLLIVSVFIVSALAAVNTPAKAQEGQYVDSITIEVRTNQQTALGEVATRDLDVFLQTVSGDVYNSISDSWKEQMNTWTSVGGYNSQYYNPAHTESPYECEVEGQLQFNPFAIKKVRMAQNFLISRQEIVNELYGGYAEPRYLWMGITSPGYTEYFEQIKEEYGFTAQGDYDKGKQMVQEGMEEAMNDPELKGSLRKGDDGFWEYQSPGGSWSDIEITGISRTEDQREEIGEMQADILRDCGFKVDNRKMDRNAYGAIVWSSDPASLQWQFYTGGWLASAAQYYQEVIPAQMGSGWYGYMPGGFVSDADYRYGYWSNGNDWNNPPENPEEHEFYGNLTMARLSSRLYQGQVNSLDQYWNWMQECTEIMTGEAVRSFIVSTYDFFAYDKDTIVSAATDVLTGWSDVFTPRTLRTTDGTLTAAQYSAQGSLYMDNWNELGGSSDVYGLQQKRMLFDAGYNLNPSNGRPMPMRMDWKDSEGEAMIEKDYQWSEGELKKNIEVPNDAVVYNSSANQWEEIGEGKKSAVKVTYDLVLGKWHTGADLTMADVMGWHAWSWDMSFDDGEGDKYFHSGFGGQMRPYLNSIIGEVWNEEEGTYTVYGDYTLPVDSKIGGYFTTWPQLQYMQYQAVQMMINHGEYAPSGIGQYSWDNTADHWVHWLSESQMGDVKTTLQNMMDDNYVPWFVSEEANAPIEVTSSELNSKMQALVDFYNEHKHLYASQGPFLMDTVNADNMYVDMVRFTEEDGYPWAEDHWEDKLRIAELSVSGSNVPSLVEAPNTLEVSFDVQVDEDFPNDVTRDVTGDDDATATIQLLNEVDEVVAEKTPTLIASTFETSFETSGLTPGSYTVRFTGSIPVQTGTTEAQASVVVQAEPEDITVSDFNVPSTAAPGEEISITATVENTGGSDTTIDVRAGGELVNSYVVGAGETVNVDETHTFTEPGTYQITVAGETKSVQVVSTNLVVNNLDVPDNAIVGDTVTISVSVENTGNAELTESIYVDGQAVEDFTLAAGESKDLSIEYKFEDTGDHDVSVGTDSQTITVQEAIVIENPSVGKDEVKKGNKVEISATITNNDDVAHDVKVTVDGDTVHTFNVEAGASQQFTYEHTFDEKGTFDVEVGGQSAGSVEVKSDGDGGGTPGFTMVLLGISAVAAVALYYRRRK